MKQKFLLLILVLPMIAATFRLDMMAGMWKQNLAKSAYGVGPAPASPAIMKVAGVPTGDKVSIDEAGPAGRKLHLDYSLRYDGKDSPVKASVDGKASTNLADAVSARKSDTYTYVVTLKRSGKIVQIQTHVFAKDGKTQTVTETGTDSQGKTFQNTLVFEKQ